MIGITAWHWFIQKRAVRETLAFHAKNLSNNPDNKDSLQFVASAFRNQLQAPINNVDEGTPLALNFLTQSILNAPAKLADRIPLVSKITSLFGSTLSIITIDSGFSGDLGKLVHDSIARRPNNKSPILFLTYDKQISEAVSLHLAALQHPINVRVDLNVQPFGGLERAGSGLYLSQLDTYLIQNGYLSGVQKVEIIVRSDFRIISDGLNVKSLLADAILRILSQNFEITSFSIRQLENLDKAARLVAQMA
jgi:hypothetical protein